MLSIQKRFWTGRQFLIRLMTILIVLNLFSQQNTAGLAESPWPKFKYDAQNTGCSQHPSITQPLVKWTFPTGFYIRSSPVIAPDGTIYIGSEDKTLYAINPDGTLKWSYTTWGEINAGSPAIASDGTIYVGSLDVGTYLGKLYAINPDGTLKWTFDLGSSAYDSLSPAIAPDGTIYVGSRKLYAINPDGTMRWSYNTGGAIQVTPALAPDGTIYVLATDAKLYAINPDGSLKWICTTYASPDYNLWSSPSVSPDGTIYFGTVGDNRIYAINPDGSLKWTFQANNLIRRSPSVAQDGTIYVGEDAGQYSAPQPGFKLYALNPDGSLKWSFEPYSAVGSPVSLASDGTIYFASSSRFYALNPDGNLEWELKIGSVHGSSPAINVDGTIFIGSYDNKLYAISGEIRTIPATVDFEPDTLNLKSSGKWVTAYIELSEGYSVSQINVSAVAVTAINDTAITPIYAESSPTEIGDHDNDAALDLTVKFNRQTLKQYLTPGDKIIKVSGKFNNGTKFMGSDTIRVID